jgi:uncharacterized protein (DUF1684 family)
MPPKTHKKKPFSGKQKKEQLKNKNAKKAEKGSFQSFHYFDPTNAFDFKLLMLIQPHSTISLEITVESLRLHYLITLCHPPTEI